jgi:tetratricopeptide (TPR) repeat protein
VGSRRHRLAQLSLAVAWAIASSCATPSEPDLSQPAPSPASVGELVERGEEARDRGDLDTAVEAFREALERTPWNDRIRKALAVSLADRAERSHASGKFVGVSAAERDLREALVLLPEDPVLRRNLGIVLLDLASRSMDPERAADLEAEARELLPAGESDLPTADALRERRIDMAMELIGRGQVEAGIGRLAALHAERPADVEIGLLLAQAHAAHGAARMQQQRLVAAAEAYDRAVAVLSSFDAAQLPAGELEQAHRNRVIAWVNAERPEAARGALQDAERAGFRLSSLRRALELDRSD